MTIRDEILAFRRQQVDEDEHLLSIPSTLIHSAEKRLAGIRVELSNTSDPSIDLIHEGQCITKALEDIRYIRGWLLFQLAWSEQGTRDKMTADEWHEYEALTGIGKRMRGETA